MLQVKVFDEEHEKDLEEAVNEFLETLNETQVLDVTFQVATSEDSDTGEVDCFFAAMVLYRK